MHDRTKGAKMQSIIKREGFGRQVSRIAVGDKPLVIVHGHPLDPSHDRVMPVFEDESIYVASRITDMANGEVLDIGTGSGILALAAAQKGCSVVGTDINHIAIRYATESAELSFVEDRCHFITGDMYKPLRGHTFDTIVVNPPFVPLPFGFPFYLSADGGPDGLGIVKRVLDGIAVHLNKNGSFLMLTMALGDDQEPLVYRYLHETFQSRGALITSRHIYETRNIEAEPFFSLFASVPMYAKWRRFLERENLTHLYYMLHEVEPYSQLKHLEQQNTTPLAKTEFSGCWAARLNRFQTWFRRKAEQDKLQRP